MVAVRSEPIDVAGIIRDLSSPGAGGTAVFLGTVRNHSHGRKVHHLEYSSYVPMAEKLMADLEEEILRRWVVHKTIMVHRIGPLGLGEVSVAVGVSAPHRKEAFEACRFAIDQIKSTVPIWKKEYSDDGPVWVGSEQTGDTPGMNA